MSRIYLDNAATSWPKPDAVYIAIDRYQRENGAAAGRGNYDSAADSARIVQQTRLALKQLIGAESNSDLIFTFNGTDGLNLCLFGYLQAGDHVITSVAEHNSILRPLSRLVAERGVKVSYADTDDHGVISLDSIRAAANNKTRLIAITHASNVTAALQPVDEIGEIAHKVGAKLLVDAAQTIGHHTINVSKQPIDMLAASGHKGLMGPLGTGFVYLSEVLRLDVQPFRYGGTGINSQSDQQPAAGPERFESGNLNMPGIAGLLAATEFHLSDSASVAITDQWAAMVLEQLRSIDTVQVTGPLDPEQRVGLVSFTIQGYDCHDVSAALNAARRIETRAGLHCAPRMHERLALDGTARASWGRFTTKEEIEIFLDVVKELAKA